MGIKTSTFGGVTLSGKAAEAFQKQFIDAPAKPNVIANKALAEGRRMLKELDEKGQILIKRVYPKE